MSIRCIYNEQEEGRMQKRAETELGYGQRNKYKE